ncbi:hypothetical protein H5410_014465 [Solanum commersonii]|uniref:Uncharacterized protein n=1 Tax=Solanum commersonii TaxID=4109 RepID=A0A9J5ZR08_SOLCO|nr:hypothetical protein H5410_014465 [Solanum commersonii]
MTKTEYLECKFNNVMHKVGVEVRLDTQVIQKRHSFNKELSYLKDKSGGDEIVMMDMWYTKGYMIKDKDIRGKVGVNLVEDKIQTNEVSLIQTYDKEMHECPNAIV